MWEEEEDEEEQKEECDEALRPVTFYSSFHISLYFTVFRSRLWRFEIVASYSGVFLALKTTWLFFIFYLFSKTILVIKLNYCSHWLWDFPMWLSCFVGDDQVSTLLWLGCLRPPFVISLLQIFFHIVPLSSFRPPLILMCIYTVIAGL